MGYTGKEEMMDNTTHASKMRMTAGIFYSALFLLQTFLVRDLLLIAPSSMPLGFIGAVLLAFAAAAGAIWMVSGSQPLSKGTVRALSLGSIFVIAVHLLTYTIQSELIKYFLTSTFQLQQENSIWIYVIVVVRLVLLLLAAFFAAATRDNKQKEDGISADQTEELWEQTQDEEETEASAPAEKEDIKELADVKAEAEEDIQPS